jgi:hypothetical protein
MVLLVVAVEEEAFETVLKGNGIRFVSRSGCAQWLRLVRLFVTSLHQPELLIRQEVQHISRFWHSGALFKLTRKVARTPLCPVVSKRPLEIR